MFHRVCIYGFQHVYLDRTVIHCPIHTEPGLAVNLPVSHGVHVFELVAPTTKLWVETGHKVHTEYDVAPTSAL